MYISYASNSGIKSVTLNLNSTLYVAANQVRHCKYEQE